MCVLGSIFGKCSFGYVVERVFYAYVCNGRIWVCVTIVFVVLSVKWMPVDSCYYDAIEIAKSSNIQSINVARMKSGIC